MTQQFTYQFKGAQAKKKLHAAAMVGMAKWGELVLQQARAIVPLDEATLERSGVVTTDDHESTVAVSFDTPYAAAQHENLEWHHPGGRQAKYLERPWLESMHWAAGMIAKEQRKVTGG